MSMSEAESRLRDIYVETARSYVGTQQGDGRHKEIIDLYNSITPLRKGGRMNTSAPWCAAFVSAMAQRCGITSIFCTGYNCDDLVSQYRAVGRYKDASSYTPQQGDWVMYADPDLPGYQHVGIFVGTTSSGKIRTIEGNAGRNPSGVREISDPESFFKNYYIAGYCQPDYASLAPSYDETSYTRIFYRGKWWKATPHLYYDARWYSGKYWTYSNSIWRTSGQVELQAPPASVIVDVSETYSKDARLSLEEMKVNARYLWQVFQAKGWTLNAVCGMLGNMEEDSTINPGAWQDYDGGGPAYGLVQWNPASKYLDWCSGRGLDPSHIDSAIARIQWEYDNGVQYSMTPSYPLTFKQFSQSTATPEYLAEVFMNNYKGTNAKDKQERLNAAREWYDYLSTTIYLPTT